MQKYYKEKEIDTSIIPISEIYLYKLYYVEPTNEIRLKIYKYNFINLDEIGTTKYYDTHLLIGQYFLLPDGNLYSEYEYRKKLYFAEKVKKSKTWVSQVFNFLKRN